MAAEAGNKATKCPETRIQHFLSFFGIKTALPRGQSQQAGRYLGPPGSHSKELAKTISLKSPAILIWQPDSITRREKKIAFLATSTRWEIILIVSWLCLTALGRALCCSFLNTQERFVSAERVRPYQLSREEGTRRGGGEIISTISYLLRYFTSVHTCNPQKGKEFENSWYSKKG